MLHHKSLKFSMMKLIGPVENGGLDVLLLDKLHYI